MITQKHIMIILITCSFFLFQSQVAKACYCSTYDLGGGVWEAYSSFDPITQTFSDARTYPSGTSGEYVFEGEVVYYVVNSDCSGELDYWLISGESAKDEFWVGALAVVKVTWGASGMGSILAYGCETVAQDVYINDCSDGNISEASTGYSSGAMTGMLTYPAAVNAGDIVYYKFATKNIYGTPSFTVTNGVLLTTYIDNNGYTVGQVEWGTAGTGSIVATAGGLCIAAESITVTTPELVFDGSDDRITIPHISAYNIGTGNFTIEGWIKASTTQNSTEATIFSKRSNTSDGIWFGLNSSGQLLLKASGYTQFVFGDDLRDDTWHHVAITRSSQSVTTFIDGVSAGVGFFGSAVDISTSNDIWLGDDDPGSNNAFTGAMKGIRFWDVARTNTDMLKTWKTNLNEYSVDMIGCWDMNETNTQSLKDRSSNANDGHLGSNSSSSDNQDPIISPADPAPFTINALAFNGNDQRVTVTHSFVYNIGTGSFTIEAHVKPNNDSYTKTIVSKRSMTTNGFWLGLTDSEVPRFQMDGVDLTSSTAVNFNDGNWHHVAVTRSGTTITIYVDGVASGTTTVSSSATITTTADIWIGKDNIAGSNGFNGLIDEVRIWSIARSGSDIAAEDNATDISDLTQTSNLKGWWRFNAAVGQTDKDLSSSANNATLGSSSSNVDLQDPLRIADQAFPGARIGFFSNSSINNYPINLDAYPNPFSSELQVNVSGLLSNEAGISIVDLIGNEVYRGTISNDEPLKLGDELNSGIYMVIIKDNSTVKTKKVIKK